MFIVAGNLSRVDYALRESEEAHRRGAQRAQ